MSKKVDLRPKREKISEIVRRVMLGIGIALVTLGVVAYFLPSWSIPDLHWIVVGTIFIIASSSGSGWFSNFSNGTKFKH